MAEVNQPGRRCESFVQYKGTSICIDVYCDCGVQLHFDGDFAYALRCWSCKTVWSLPSQLILVEGMPPSGIVQDTVLDQDETPETARWRD